MPLSWTYQPPAVNAIPLVALAAAAGAEAGANIVLAASQPLVPVETGALRDSGRVVTDGAEAYVTYGRDDDGGDGSPTNDYAVVQHEGIDFHHPNGGQSKFLEQPMHGSAAEVAVAIAAELRKVIGA